MALSIFTCWAECPSGALRRLEVTATSGDDARLLAFAACPRAIAVTCRTSTRVAYAEERRHG